MAYYLAPALVVLRAEVNSRWPGRDKSSDGWIGDTAHQAGRSDHNPNSRGSVNALDIDKDGIAVTEVIAAIERHPSTHYWIYQRQIADRDDGWRRRPYTGNNPHDKHLHVSVRQTRAAEQDRRPWGLLEDAMPNFTERHAAVLDQLATVLPTLTAQTAYTDARVEAIASGRPTVRADLRGGGQPVWLVQMLRGLPALLAAEGTSAAELAAALAALPVDADEPAIVAGVLAGLGGRAAVDVAQALVAAGQDPAELAAALTRIAAGARE